MFNQVFHLNVSNESNTFCNAVNKPNMSTGQIWPQASHLHSLAGRINGQTDQATGATGVYPLPHRPHRLSQELAATTAWEGPLRANATRQHCPSSGTMAQGLCHSVSSKLFQVSKNYRLRGRKS